MRIFVVPSLLLSFGLASLPAHAQTRRLNIQSKADQYELLLTGNTGTVNGKTADLTGIKDFLGVLTNPLTNECPTQKGTADVTVKENGQSRSIYLARGIVSDGVHCVNVLGDGLLYFPIHRDFLIGPKQDALAVRSPLKIFRQGVKLFELKKVGETWEPEGTTMLLDWDFLERFENSLKSFTVRFRAQPELAKDKPKMIVQSGEQSYEFYKITKVTWALKKPGHRWLEASDDWSFWYDFDDGILEDHFTPQIRALEDTSKPKAERMAIMEKLGANYSRNLHDLYRHMVLSAGEDHDIKRLAIQRLHQKPTLETALAMVKFLQVSDDEDMKKTAGQILKTQNPKGPLYRPSAPAEDKTKTVNYWVQWAEKYQHAP